MRTVAAALTAAVVAGLFAVGPASGIAGSQPTVVDGLAAMYLQYSAWADQNDLDPLGTACVGIEGAKKGVVDVEHTAFRCTVARGGKKAGVVIATALGPEWLRVTRIVSGALKPERGIGAVPKGREAMVYSDAEFAVMRSSWARANKVGKSFCTGVGPYKKALLGLQFGAFSCATYDRSGRRSGTVLVQVVSSSSLRVVRRLS
ncbi:MAG TPA: hypothetical protein VLJ76_05490 [Gaiellaceae bacterium]|nr:hypothetical protein [Gaiellaceae bacterium]